MGALLGGFIILVGEGFGLGAAAVGAFLAPPLPIPPRAAIIALKCGVLLAMLSIRLLLVVDFGMSREDPWRFCGGVAGWRRSGVACAFRDAGMGAE